MSRRNEWEEWEGSDQVTEAVEKGREHAEKKRVGRMGGE